MISENLKSTIIGVIAAALAIAVGAGWLTPEQSEQITTGITGLIENIGGVILGISSLFLIFKNFKD